MLARFNRRVKNCPSFYKFVEMQINNTQSVICNWCNQPSTIIWVHGHGQCSVCGINIDECCKGETHPPTPSQDEGEKEETVND